VEAEVVVVDDGSREPVQVPPEEYSGEERVRVVRHDEPRGVAAARNAGIAAARGDWLAFLDDDDVWAPSKLELTLAAAVTADARFAYSGALEVLPDGRLYCLAPSDPLTLPHILLTAAAVPAAASNLIVEASLVRELGGFDEEFAILPDWDLVVRLCIAAKAASTHEPLVAYRIHGSNMQQDEAGLLADLERFETKHARALENAGVALDRTAWLNWHIRGRRLAGDRRGAARLCVQLGWLSRDPVMVARGIVIMAAGERGATSLRSMRGRLRRRADACPAPSWLAELIPSSHSAEP
jgi:glycosyltransferase involved in cell wall biosynthesis